jgi:4-hydroxy-tetrahydrodipicolinate reductase
MTTKNKIKVAQFGLGPIGIEALKLAASKPWVEIVGGVDIAPDKIGRDLADLTGLPALAGRQVYPHLDALLTVARPDVVLHTSVSKFAAAAAQIEPIVRHGISVVSSSEELLCPSFRDPQLAARLDSLCQQHNARVLGTGVNPGFVMDVLPVVMTGVSRSVTRITVQRVVNATTRRGPLQRKIGSGWTPEEFERRFREGSAGHAGLQDSVALIAHCLGWKLDGITETGRAMVADHDITTPHVQVKRGQCCGLHQVGVATMNGRSVIELDLKMYLDAPDPHDAIQIEGEPPLRVRIEGGVAGDHATVAAVVNAVPRVLAAKPGLRVMTDIAVPCLA